ncbi:MAG TPA: class I SAM-dependent RNA methyltransferase, partial [Spirochaetia bacterium]|nr:class I SAM-dependent RNA methyltransferase [Spirochaetia bacterium]
KRGYRAETGAAPLRANRAAALVLLSRWDASRPRADPVCGSGTIAIEAALIASGAAPGIRRGFAAEKWPTLPARIWQDARQEAREAERGNVPVSIWASDKDRAMVDAATRNASKAGVSASIRFSCAPLRAFSSSADYGCIVCNPPYGERLGEQREVQALTREMGALYDRLDTWSFYVLSGDTEFPRLFGTRASKNRKLYNGNIRCYFYQYYRPRGPRHQG